MIANGIGGGCNDSSLYSPCCSVLQDYNGSVFEGSRSFVTSVESVYNTISDSSVTQSSLNSISSRSMTDEVSSHNNSFKSQDQLTNVPSIRIIDSSIQNLNSVNGSPSFLIPLKLTAIPNSVYTENEYHYYQPKRSSSLRKGTTPPGTPSVKKVVRFADALGLDLAIVRQVFDLEQPPNIPKSAMVDLTVNVSDSGLNTDELSSNNIQQALKFYSPLFSQPSVSRNFIHRILQDHVCLENVDIDDHVLNGFIKVKNACYNKEVNVRLSHNCWFSHTDHKANFVAGCSDGITDRFSFTITIPPNLVVGSKIQFAIHYRTESGEEFWDSNFGQNYVFDITNVNPNAVNNNSNNPIHY